VNQFLGCEIDKFYDDLFDWLIDWLFNCL
jgi:hypothetical protein